MYTIKILLIMINFTTNNVSNVHTKLFKTNYTNYPNFISAIEL